MISVHKAHALPLLYSKPALGPLQIVLVAKNQTKLDLHVKLGFGSRKAFCVDDTGILCLPALLCILGKATVAEERRSMHLVS